MSDFPFEIGDVLKDDEGHLDILLHIHWHHCHIWSLLGAGINPGIYTRRTEQFDQCVKVGSVDASAVALLARAGGVNV